MAAEIKIRRKGLFKSEIKLKDLLKNDLELGIHSSSYVLKDFEGQDKVWLIIYDPKNIGRGISIFYENKLKGDINLSVSLPTASIDFDVLYKIMQRIKNKAKIKNIEIDGELFSMSEVPAKLDKLKTFSRNYIKDIDTEAHSSLTIFAAMFPITMSKEQMENFKFNPYLFDEWLNEKQQEDVYYPTIQFYKDNKGSYIGVYVLSTDVTSVFPVKPHVPIGFELKDEEVSWKTAIFSSKQEKVIGELPYEKFVELLELKDAETFCEGMKYITLSETLALSLFGIENSKFAGDFYLETEEIDNDNPSWADVQAELERTDYNEDDPPFIVLDCKESVFDVQYIQAAWEPDNSFIVELRIGEEDNFKHYRTETKDRAKMMKFFKTIYEKQHLDYSDWEDVTKEF